MCENGKKNKMNCDCVDCRMVYMPYIYHLG